MSNVGWIIVLASSLPIMASLAICIWVQMGKQVRARQLIKGEWS